MKRTQRELFAATVDWEGLDWSLLEPGHVVEVPRDEGWHEWVRLRVVSTGPTWLTLSDGLRIDWRSGCPAYHEHAPGGFTTQYRARVAPPLDDDCEGV